MGVKDTIVTNLTIVRDAEDLAGNKFKVRAYDRVLEQISGLPSRKRIKTVEDLIALGVTGIGDSIKNKIKEILETGTLASAADEKKKVECYKILSKIHGIGHVKAKELLGKGICTIEDLRAQQDIHLNDIQKTGLKYYENFEKRIPRKEMIQHETLLKEAFKDFEFTMAGSFRRGAKTSGDIDILVTKRNSTPEEASALMKHTVSQLKERGYITDTLAIGDKKCMAVVKLPRHKVFRRLDIMVTPPEEYPYAIMYFTGSQAFNVGFRAMALSKGYTINEHRMKPTGKTKSVSVPIFETEKDIFDFFGIPFVRPEDRNENIFVG